MARGPHNYRRINYVYSFSGPWATASETVFDTRWGEKGKKKPREQQLKLKLKKSQLDDGRWKMEAGGVQHAKPNFISHFEKDKLNINAREKPKKEPKLEHNKGEYETYQ